MQEIDFYNRLLGPFTCLVAGPTGCGKTELVFSLIERAETLIHPPPSRVVYCYGAWQSKFEKYRDRVQFHEGLLSREEIISKADAQHTLLIIDDLMDASNATLIKDIFIKWSHHTNTSVVVITQNLFLPHKDYRTVSLNAHYMIIFKNPRDGSQILSMARQVFPHNPTFLSEVYNKETGNRHSYLLLDFKQGTPDALRVRQSVTSPRATTVFVPRK